MKKISLHIIVLIAIVSINSVPVEAQNKLGEDLDFFVQYQSSRNYDVIIYPNPVTDFRFKINGELQ